MLNLKACRKEGCGRGRNLLQVSTQSSPLQLLARTRSLEDSATQEALLDHSGSLRFTTLCPPHNL